MRVVLGYDSGHPDELRVERDGVAEDLHSLVERLTGCAPEEVALACSREDLEAVRLLLDDALEVKERRPALRLAEG